VNAFGLAFNCVSILFMSILFMQTTVLLLALIFKKKPATRIGTSYKLDLVIPATDINVLSSSLEKWKGNSHINRIFVVCPRDFPESERITVVKDGKNGLALAVNAAMRFVTTEFAVLADEDNYFPDDCVSEMMSYFADSSVVGVSPRLRPYGRSTSFMHRAIESERTLAEKYYQPFACKLGFGTFTGKGILRVSAFRELGGFRNERLTEDIDYSVRALLRGYRFVNSLSEGYELYPNSFKSLVKQRVRWAYGWFQVAFENVVHPKSLGVTGCLIFALLSPLMALMMPMLLLSVFLPISIVPTLIGIGISAYYLVVPLCGSKDVRVVLLLQLLGAIAIYAMFLRPKRFEITQKAVSPFKPFTASS